jgi:hypothetical protein
MEKFRGDTGLKANGRSRTRVELFAEACAMLPADVQRLIMAVT